MTSPETIIPDTSSSLIYERIQFSTDLSKPNNNLFPIDVFTRFNMGEASTGSKLYANFVWVISLSLDMRVKICEDHKPATSIKIVSNTIFATSLLLVVGSNSDLLYLLRSVLSLSRSHMPFLSFSVHELSCRGSKWLIITLCNHMYMYMISVTLWEFPGLETNFDLLKVNGGNCRVIFWVAVKHALVTMERETLFVFGFIEKKTSQTWL